MQAEPSQIGQVLPHIASARIQALSGLFGGEQGHGCPPAVSRPPGGGVARRANFWDDSLTKTSPKPVDSDLGGGVFCTDWQSHGIHQGRACQVSLARRIIWASWPRLSPCPCCPCRKACVQPHTRPANFSRGICAEPKRRPFRQAS